MRTMKEACEAVGCIPKVRIGGCYKFIHKEYKEIQENAPHGFVTNMCLSASAGVVVRVDFRYTEVKEDSLKEFYGDDVEDFQLFLYNIQDGDVWEITEM